MNERILRVSVNFLKFLFFLGATFPCFILLKGFYSLSTIHPFIYWILLSAAIFLTPTFFVTLIAVFLRLLPKPKPGIHKFGSPQFNLWLFTAWVEELIVTSGFINEVHNRSMLAGRWLANRSFANSIVASNVAIHDPYLCRFGKECFIGMHVFITCHIIKKNSLYLFPVQIGSKVAVGTRSIIGPGVVLEDAVKVGIGAKIGPNVKVGKNTIIDSLVTIGDNCVIEEKVIVGLNATLGKNVLVKKGTWIRENSNIPSDSVIEVGSHFDKKNRG